MIHHPQKNTNFNRLFHYMQAMNAIVFFVRMVEYLWPSFRAAIRVWVEEKNNRSSHFVRWLCLISFWSWCHFTLVWKCHDAPVIGWRGGCFWATRNQKNVCILCISSRGRRSNHSFQFHLWNVARYQRVGWDSLYLKYCLIIGNLKLTRFWIINCKRRYLRSESNQGGLN